MDKKHIEFAEMLVRVLNKYTEQQKRSRKYGLDELLYPAEIHMIMTIGNTQAPGVTEIAAKLGVTKGAVSQIVQKLVNKGLIIKVPDPGNGTRVILQLTGKGKTAYDGHRKFHEEMDKELFAFLKGLNKQQLRVLEDFFHYFESGIEKRSET
ncbi:MAG TPA: MarR family transcriptional regulator [candidate division Zixibacteria bacterium]|nr:MarR family transcriptional regulator [candidate division Zixibacteria bacterium]